MAAPPLLLLQDIKLTISGKPLLEGVELSVSPGEKLALVGRNGSGKSTLLRIAAGEIQADEGTRFIQPGISVRYLPQEPDLTGYSTSLDYAQAGLGPADDPWRAQFLLNELGLSGTEKPDQMSGGERRRTALANVLAPEPDILLLDEPTNHLDLPAIEWLENTIAATRSALVLISHDRRFLENLSRATVWLDRGAARRLDQGFGHFEEWRDTVLEQEEREQHKLDRKIVAEEHWVRYGVTARRKRNVRRMANLAELRNQRREHRQVQGNVKLEASQAQTSGKLVADAKTISKSFGGTDVVKDFSIRIARGDRIGIAGPNGAGKTTLIKMLTGDLQPDSGSVRHGAGLETATLDQQRQQLKDTWTLKDALTGGSGDYVDINGTRKHVVGYMQDFLFRPEQARQPVTKLSGGERGRLALARALSLPSNFLVLDEPTNDLDLETLDLLQEMIGDYPGTVIVVSHDRDFLDRVATSLIAFEGEGRWQEYAGGYSDMIAQRGAAPSASKQKMESPKPQKTETDPVQSGAGGSKRKLSFKDKHALETLPKTLEDLLRRKEKLLSEMGDPDLYSRDPKRFNAISETLGNIETEISAAEEQWLELEMLREEVEG